MILYSRWVALSLPTRNKIAQLFSITKKGATQVDSNVVKHDGYVIEDIEAALTQEAMENFLGLRFASPELLWEAVVNKVEEREVEGGVPFEASAPKKTKASAVSVLPPKEAAQFKKEHKARVKTAKVKAAVTKTKKTSKKNGK